MNIAKLCSCLTVAALVTQPVLAETRLGAKDRERVARAPARERSEVRYCLTQRKKGGKDGAIIGAAGGAGVGLIAGGGVGETLLGAGAGAVAGHLIGKGTATKSRCDDVLRRNR